MTKEGDWSKLHDRLQKLSKNMSDIVPAIRKLATPTRVDMQSRARVRTGFMRDHIVESDIEGGFQVHSQAPYSGFQEFGTSRGITPNLFFRPPAAKAISDAKSIVKKEATK